MLDAVAGTHRGVVLVMVDHSKLSPAEFQAAMRGGTVEWGRWGSALEHVRYVEPIGKTRNWRKCHCGCGKRATHRGAANGVTLTVGCELSMRRWVKDPRPPRRTPR